VSVDKAASRARADEVWQWAREELAGLDYHGCTLILSGAGERRISCRVKGRDGTFVDNQVTFHKRDSEWRPSGSDYAVVGLATQKLNEVTAP
jgi:hypothetical protein